MTPLFWRIFLQHLILKNCLISWQKINWFFRNLNNSKHLLLDQWSKSCKHLYFWWCHYMLTPLPHVIKCHHLSNPPPPYGGDVICGWSLTKIDRKKSISISIYILRIWKQKIWLPCKTYSQNNTPKLKFEIENDSTLLLTLCYTLTLNFSLGQLHKY